MGVIKLVWTLRAQQHLTEKALLNPEYYNRDKFKIANDGSYRAFERHHYRIVYRFQKNIIRVLRVRHTSMEPKKY